MGIASYRQAGTVMTHRPLLVLAGCDAVALASRLTASGYATIDWLNAGAAAGQIRDQEGPAAAILAADQKPLIAELRQRFGAIPILLDLQHDSVHARSDCLNSGADDFWLSTVGPSDLLLRLRLHRTIQKRFTADVPVLQVEDLRCDPSRRCVHRGSRSIPLTAREYDLLLVLMQHPGRVFSRDELLQSVWREERSGSSNVVEVYVRYLRQKLEEAGEPRLLKTVRGIGYRLGASDVGRL